MRQAIEVTWQTGSAAEYTDVFPAAEFSSEVKGAERLHIVRGPQGGLHNARYRLNVSGRRASLDYRAFKAFNSRHGMENGVLDFFFANPARTHVEETRWNGRLIKASDAKVETKMETLPTSLAEALGERQKALAEIVLRPGQVEFRQQLDRIYGARCCISGCPVPRALEAAHIESFSAAGSDDPTNGLLLRRDLHALFDAEEIAIHPASRIVTFSSEAKTWPEYDKWSGRVKLARPQPGYESQAPKLSYLEKRWKRFRKA